MNKESLGYKNFALYFQQLQDTGNDRRVTPIAEEISKEEFYDYLKKEEACLRINNPGYADFCRKKEVENGSMYRFESEKCH